MLLTSIGALESTLVSQAEELNKIVKERHDIVVKKNSTGQLDELTQGKVLELSKKIPTQLDSIRKTITKIKPGYKNIFSSLKNIFRRGGKGKGTKSTMRRLRRLRRRSMKSK